MPKTLEEGKNIELGKEKKAEKKNVGDYTWTKIQMFPRQRHKSSSFSG